MYRNILITLGSALIGASLIAFFQFVQLIYQLFHNPEQVGILQFIIKHIPETQEIISGTINTEHFTIQLAEPFRLLSCLIVITLCSSVLVGVFRIIMMAGMELIKLGIAQTTAEFDNYRS